MKLFIFLELEELVDFLRKKNNKTKLFFLLLISLQLIKKEKVLCIENCNVKKNAMTDILIPNIWHYRDSDVYTYK